MFKSQTIERWLGSYPELPAAMRIRMLKDLDMLEAATREHTSKDAAWKSLLARVRHVRRSNAAHAADWTGEEGKVRAEYLAVLDAIIARIEKAKDTIDPSTGAPYTAQAYALTRIGKEAKGACLPNRWQTWCPPAVASDLVERMRTVRQGTRGRPPALFWPSIDAKEFDAQADKHTTTIDKIRRQFSAYGREDGASSISDTPYGALWLAAARMAEIQLLRLLNPDYVPYGPMWTRTIPANFHALLDAPMRQRLRDARRAPDEVIVDEGLRHFYDRLIHTTAAEAIALRHTLPTTDLVPDEEDTPDQQS